jgi:hypothetical protein
LPSQGQKISDMRHWQKNYQVVNTVPVNYALRFSGPITAVNACPGQVWLGLGNIACTALKSLFIWPAWGQNILNMHHQPILNASSCEDTN